MLNKIQTLALLFGLTAAKPSKDCLGGKGCKFGVFSDFHYMDDYDPRLSNKKYYCAKGMREAGDYSSDGATDDAPVAKLGRLGCDGPRELAEAMMQLFV